MDFVEICNVYVGQMLVKAAERKFNSDKKCRSYNDLNFDDDDKLRIAKFTVLLQTFRSTRIVSFEHVF